MCLHPEEISPVPEATALVAKSAFPKGNLYMRLRDELGVFYHDEDSPHIITHVETTVATTQDLTVVPSIHEALSEKTSCLNSTWLTKHTHQYNYFLAQSETMTLTCWGQ
jgi:hypothetical protein